MKAGAVLAMPRSDFTTIIHFIQEKKPPLVLRIRASISALEDFGKWRKIIGFFQPPNHKN
jgi:hypothetical protein